MIHALLVSHLDGCNAAFTCLCQNTTARLQCVQKAAARLLTGSSVIIFLYCSFLHWLPICFRNDFKALLFFQVVHGTELPDGTLNFPQTSLRSSDRALDRTEGRGDRGVAVRAPTLRTASLRNLDRKFTTCFYIISQDLPLPCGF